MPSKWMIAVVAAWVLAGCHAKTPAPPASTHAATPTLDKAITGELIGERTAYLESLIGPAMHIEGDVRDYRPDGCEFQVSDHDGVVQWFRLRLDQRCTFDPHKVFPQTRLPALSTLTFGAAERAEGPLRYEADCLTDCGREGAAGLYAIYTGPEAVQNMEFVASTDHADDAAGDAAAAWEKALLPLHGQSWVSDHDFNCASDDEGAAKALALVRVKYIAFGRGIPSPSSSCSETSQAAAEPTANLTSDELKIDPDDVYTAETFRAAVIGKSEDQLVARFGRPLTVHDDIEPGSQMLDYSSDESFLGHVPFLVIDASTMKPLSSVTVHLDESKRVSSVTF